MSTLGDLIAPMSIDTFFQDYWTKEPLLIPGDEDKFADLFHWQALNDLLNSNYKRIEPPDIRMVIDTESVKREVMTEEDIRFIGQNRKRNYVSPEKVQRLSKRGATTIVASVHEIDRNLQKFTHELLKEFGEEQININAYFSRDGVKAFHQHYDPYDLFVIQVEGSKTWHLYGYTDEYPLYGLHRPGHMEAPPFTKSIKVTKGDVLYMPRGYWHAAVAQGDDSLHLTMGIICRKGVDFFSWLLQEELRHQAIFRKNLPLIYQEEGAKDFTETEMQAFLPVLREQLNEIFDDTAGLVEKYNTYLKEQRNKYSNTVENPFNFP